MTASLRTSVDAGGHFRRRPFFYQRLPGLEERPGSGRPLFSLADLVEFNAVRCELPSGTAVRAFVREARLLWARPTKVNVGYPRDAVHQYLSYASMYNPGLAHPAGTK
jgi:hypothetical protein